MFENYYGDNIPRRARFVKRQEFILTLKYVINKWELLQKPLHFVIKKGITYTMTWFHGEEDGVWIPKSWRRWPQRCR